MKRTEATYLLDMLLAAQDVMEFASGLRFQQFAQDRRNMSVRVL